jgi:hypothetical protein
MKNSLKSILFLLAVIAVGLAASGCATTESENLSSRPWNSPTTWQNGLPTSINEGR